MYSNLNYEKQLLVVLFVTAVMAVAYLGTIFISGYEVAQAVKNRRINTEQTQVVNKILTATPTKVQSRKSGNMTTASP